jgi:DNA-binding transcriptional regulator YiaG
MVRYTDHQDLHSRLLNQIRDILPSLLTRRDSLKGHAGIRLGERIRELRIARRMTHEDLARVAGMESFSPEQIRQWEESTDLESNLSVIYLRKIAAALEVAAADLLV